MQNTQTPPQHAPLKATLPPVFQHMNEVFAVEALALRHGLALLKDCVVVNPDGTGFGGGSLEMRLLTPMAGDQIRLLPTEALAIRGDEIFIGGRLAAHRLPGTPAAAGTELLLQFEPQTYFDTLAAMLTGIELYNPRPVAGDREIVVAITDADGDRTDERLSVLVSAPAARDPAAAFNVLSPAERRLAVRRMIAALLPGAFMPRFPPSDVEFSSHISFREYAAFELEALWNAQSRGIMVEMIPLLYPYLARLSVTKRVLRCLDVASGTGAGAALLADIFQSSFAAVRLEIDTIDLDDTFRDYQVVRWPNLQRAIIGNPLDLADGSYDIVLCRHLEQSAEPDTFVRKLARIARDYAFVYCPRTGADPVTEGQSLPDAVIGQLQPLERRPVPSWGWRPDGPVRMQERVFCVIAGAGGNPPE